MDVLCVLIFYSRNLESVRNCTVLMAFSISEESWLNQGCAQVLLVGGFYCYYKKSRILWVNKKLLDITLKTFNELRYREYLIIVLSVWSGSQSQFSMCYKMAVVNSVYKSKHYNVFHLHQCQHAVPQFNAKCMHIEFDYIIQARM